MNGIFWQPHKHAANPPIHQGVSSHDQTSSSPTDPALKKQRIATLLSSFATTSLSSLNEVTTSSDPSSVQDDRISQRKSFQHVLDIAKKIYETNPELPKCMTFQLGTYAAQSLSTVPLTPHATINITESIQSSQLLFDNRSSSYQTQVKSVVVAAHVFKSRLELTAPLLAILHSVLSENAKVFVSISPDGDTHTQKLVPISNIEELDEYRDQLIEPGEDRYEQLLQQHRLARQTTFFLNQSGLREINTELKHCLPLSTEVYDFFNTDCIELVSNDSELPWVSCSVTDFFEDDILTRFPSITHLDLSGVPLSEVGSVLEYLEVSLHGEKRYGIRLTHQRSITAENIEKLITISSKGLLSALSISIGDCEENNLRELLQAIDSIDYLRIDDAHSSGRSVDPYELPPLKTFAMKPEPGNLVFKILDPDQLEHFIIDENQSDPYTSVNSQIHHLSASFVSLKTLSLKKVSIHFDVLQSVINSNSLTKLELIDVRVTFDDDIHMMMRGEGYANDRHLDIRKLKGLRILKVQNSNNCRIKLDSSHSIKELHLDFDSLDVEAYSSQELREIFIKAEDVSFRCKSNPLYGNVMKSMFSDRDIAKLQNYKEICKDLFIYLLTTPSEIKALDFSGFIEGDWIDLTSTLRIQNQFSVLSLPFMSYENLEFSDQAPKLEELKLYSLSEEGLDFLCSTQLLTHCKQLTIDGWVFNNAGLSKLLTVAGRLQKLTIVGTAELDETELEFPVLPHLQSLDINIGENMTINDFAVMINNFPQLNSLRVRNFGSSGSIDDIELNSFVCCHCVDFEYEQSSEEHQFLNGELHLLHTLLQKTDNLKHLWFGLSWPPDLDFHDHDLYSVDSDEELETYDIGDVADKIAPYTKKLETFFLKGIVDPDNFFSFIPYSKSIQRLGSTVPECGFRTKDMKRYPNVIYARGDGFWDVDLTGAMDSKSSLSVDCDTLLGADISFDATVYYNSVTPAVYRLRSFTLTDSGELIEAQPNFIEPVNVTRLEKIFWDIENPQGVARFQINENVDEYEIPTVMENQEFVYWWSNEVDDVQFLKDPAQKRYLAKFKEPLSETTTLMFYVRFPEPEPYPEEVVQHRKNTPFMRAILACERMTSKEEHKRLTLEDYQEREKQNVAVSPMNMKTYFRSFTPGKLSSWEELLESVVLLRELENNDNHGDKKSVFTENQKRILQFIFSKHGSCRHRSFAAMAFCKEVLGVESYLWTNETHAFIESRLKPEDTHLTRFDLGGYPAKIKPLQPIRHVPFIESSTKLSEAEKKLRETAIQKQRERFEQKSTQLMDIESILDEEKELHQRLDQISSFSRVASLNSFESIIRDKSSDPILFRSSADKVKQIRYAITKTLRQDYYVVFISSESDVAKFSTRPRSLQEQCVLLCEWNKISDSDRVSLHTLFDPNPIFNSSPLHFRRVISIWTSDKVPFNLRRRHPKRFDLGSLSLLNPTEIIKQEQRSVSSKAIDLKRGDSNWKPLLFGKVSWDFRIEIGAFSEQRLTLQNIPETEEFDSCIEEVLFNQRYIQPCIENGRPSAEFRLLKDDFSITRTSIGYDTQELNTITAQQFQAYKNSGRKMWVVTKENYHLFEPHEALQGYQEKVRPMKHDGFRLEINWEKDIVCMEKQLPNHVLASFQPYLHYCYSIDLDLFSDLPVVSHVPTAHVHFGSDQHFDEFISYQSMRSGQPLFEGLQKREGDVLKKLQDPRHVIAFYGLKDHNPLKGMLLLAQHSGHFLTQGQRLDINATIQFKDNIPCINPRLATPEILSSTSETFIDDLARQINTFRRVVMFGDPGVGKSTALQTLNNQGKLTVFQGLTKIHDWLTSSAINPTLVIDEFNLLPEGVLDFLFGGDDSQDEILFKGKLWPVHGRSFVLIGNQASQIGRSGTEIENACKKLTIVGGSFSEMLPTVNEKVKTLLRKQDLDTLEPIGTSFFSLVKEHIPEYPLSARDLQMILILPNDFSGLQTSFIHSCYESLLYFFQQADKETYLNDWMESHEMVVPEQKPIHDTIIYEVERFLSLREMNSYLGKMGLLLEGEPGVGKSYSIEELLSQKGFSKTHPESTKRYYKLSFSPSGIDDALNKLDKASREGSVCIVEELNSNTILAEEKLNDYLSSGLDNHHPQFRVIASQNDASTLDGLIPLPESLLSRFHCVRLRAPQEQDLADLAKKVCTNHAVSEDLIQRMIKVYLVMKSDYRYKEQLTPADLFQLINEGPSGQTLSLLQFPGT